jgi:hypothetical protein
MYPADGGYIPLVEEENNVIIASLFFQQYQSAEAGKIELHTRSACPFIDDTNTPQIYNKTRYATKKAKAEQMMKGGEGSSFL